MHGPQSSALPRRRTDSEIFQMTRKIVDLMCCAEDERRPRMTPELEALHARALLEARRRRILRDGFKASIEQLAVSTRCREDR